MKIVIDTNVLLSSFLTDGLAKKVFNSCIDNDDIYLSEWILNELKTKLEKKFKVPESDIHQLIRFLKQICKIVEPVGIVDITCRDEMDIPVLLLADYVSADILLTGDNDLLNLISYKKVKIMNPRSFYELNK